MTGRRWRLRAAMAVTALAWGVAGMVVLVGLNLLWVESMRRLGVPTGLLALVGRLPGAGRGMGEAAWAWVLREGLDGVVGFARTHPGVTAMAGPVGGVFVGPGALAIAIVLTAVAIRLLARP